MDFLGRTWTYALQWELQPVAAVFVWGAIEVVSMVIALAYWVKFYNGLPDLINFAATAALMTPNLFSLLIVSFKLDSEGARGWFWKTGMLGALVPLLVYPGLFFTYIVHAYINRSKYTTVTYMVTKYLLFFFQLYKYLTMQFQKVSLQ